MHEASAEELKAENNIWRRCVEELRVELNDALVRLGETEAAFEVLAKARAEADAEVARLAQLVKHWDRRAAAGDPVQRDGYPGRQSKR